MQMRGLDGSRRADHCRLLDGRDEGGWVDGDRHVAIYAHAVHGKV